MQLLLMIAVVAALSIADAAPDCIADHAASKLALALLAMGSMVALAASISIPVAARVRSEGTSIEALLRRFAKLQRCHAALALAVGLAILWLLDWPQLIRANAELRRAFLLDDLLILAPVLIPLILSWAIFYEVDSAIDPKSATGRLHYVGFCIRHYLGALLAPVVLLLGVHDAAELAWPGFSESSLAPLALLVPLAGAVIFFPAILRVVWQTSPLEAGPLRERLVARAESGGCPPRELYVWHSSNRVINAAVAGFVPRFRYVFLSDGLLRAFCDDHLAAIFAHEMAHVERRHLWLRVFSIVAPVAIWLGATSVLNRVLPGFGDDLANLMPGIPLETVGAALLLAYAAFAFGRHSRWLEHDADLAACLKWEPSPDGKRRTSSVDFAAAEHLACALERLGDLSGGNHRQSSWLHPSIDTRIEFLARMANNPAAVISFLGRMRILAALSCAAVVSPLLIALFMA